jgi:hypothetical protein
MRGTRLRKSNKPNLRKASQYPAQTPIPRPTPFERSPIPFLAPSQFSRIQEFGERFKRIVSEPIFKRSFGDEEDFTAKIKPRKRPPPPWLAEKMYGSRNENEGESEEDQEDGGDDSPFHPRRRIR